MKTSSFLPVMIVVTTALSTGCGQPDGSTPVELADRESGSNQSGADLSECEQIGTFDISGGSVALPDGTRVSIGPAGIGQGVSTGLSVANSAPDSDHAGMAVTPWIHAVSSVLDAQTTIAAPFIIEVPVLPPSGAETHPGLQIMIVMPGGHSFPVEGQWDGYTGMFTARLASLPPDFTFAVTWNPDIERLDGYTVPDESNMTTTAAMAALATRDGGGWTTTDFVIDFDGRKVTIEQARKVARVAREAAKLYSAAGFLEPFLFKDTGITGDRWHIHLTNKGSAFDSNHNPAAADEASRFGRLYTDISRIDTPVTDDIGSVLASVAHEMFHAIFHSYQIPYVCFNYQSDGQTWCHRSSTGFNEGAATAIGYAIDQKQPKPRPTEPPFFLYAPLGYFDHNARSVAYRNQDFFVFLLRVGSLSNVEKLVSSLSWALMPEGNTTTYRVLSAYGDILELMGAGFNIGFTELVGGYTANRGFLREYEGHIWPAEPAGGTAGAQFVLDKTLFGPMKFNIDARDCEEDLDTYTATCTATLTNMPPMSGGLVTIDISDLAGDWSFEPGQVAVSATTTGGSVAYWVFGEDAAGAGADGAFGNAMNGADAALPGGASEWPVARILVTQGGAIGTVTVKVLISEAARGATYQGSGTLTQTLTPGGTPATCPQTVQITLEVDHIAGWVELNFNATDIHFQTDADDNATCWPETTISAHTLWVSGHPDGQFTLSHSGLTEPWLNGTYDRDSATGEGSFQQGDYSETLSFWLTRVNP